MSENRLETKMRSELNRCKDPRGRGMCTATFLCTPVYGQRSQPSSEKSECEDSTAACLLGEKLSIPDVDLADNWSDLDI